METNELFDNIRKKQETLESEKQELLNALKKCYSDLVVNTQKNYYKYKEIIDKYDIHSQK